MPGLKLIHISKRCPRRIPSNCALQWRHNERDGVSNQQPYYCLLNRLFRHRWRKTSKPRVTGLCEGNSPVTGEFSAQRASDAEKIPFDDFIMIYTYLTWSSAKLTRLKNAKMMCPIRTFTLSKLIAKTLRPVMGGGGVLLNILIVMTVCPKMGR